MLDTLDWQTVKADEVIIINMGPSDEHLSRIQEVVSSHPSATHIAAPIPKFNVSWGINVGIVRAKSEYIAVVGYEMLFSQGAIEAVKMHMGHNIALSGCCGFLGRHLDLSDPISNWDSLYSTLRSYYIGSGREGTKGPAGGTIHVMHRDQWHKMRGYNEKFRLIGASTELINRATKDGIKRVVIKCKEAIWLHPHHEQSKLLGEYPAPHPYGKSDPIQVTENPDGWGEM